MDKGEVGTIDEALRELGVTDNTLTTQQKRALDEQGYVLFAAVMDKRWLAELRAAYEALHEADRRDAGNFGTQKDGTRHVDDILNRSAAFDGVFTHPLVVAAAWRVFGREFRFARLHGRDPLPGFGQQGLHTDWQPRGDAAPYVVVNSIWMLDDFTRENGATRVVPGTHLLPNTPPKNLADPNAHHPDEIFVTAPAGSVLFFNAHLWHSGTRNGSKGLRRSLQCAYAAREIPSNLALTPGTVARLSPAARYLTGT